MAVVLRMYHPLPNLYEEETFMNREFEILTRDQTSNYFRAYLLVTSCLITAVVFAVQLEDRLICAADYGQQVMISRREENQ